MIPTSARRRIEKKTISQSSSKAPSYTMGADLALVHCPSINRNNLEGETNKQTSNMCASDKGKQTNKQTSRGSMCRGVDAGGGVESHNMWSHITCGVQYAMHQSMWKSFGDASEMHQKSMEFDTQGCTLTSPPF